MHISFYSYMYTSKRLPPQALLLCPQNPMQTFLLKNKLLTITIHRITLILNINTPSNILRHILQQLKSEINWSGSFRNRPIRFRNRPSDPKRVFCGVVLVFFGDKINAVQPFWGALPGLDEGVDLVDGLLFGVVFSGEPGSHGAYFFLLFIFYMQYNRDFDYFFVSQNFFVFICV